MHTLFLASTAVAFTTGGLVPLLVWLLIAALLIYILFLVIGMLPLPQPIK